MNKPISIQRSLFNQPTLNVAKPIKAALNKDVQASGLSREQIVDRMNELADCYGVCLVNGNCKRLTIETFEKWLNSNDLKRQIPLKAIPVFCAAVKKHSSLDVMARSLGMRVVGDREQKLLSWAEAKMAIREHNRTVKKLESEI